MTLSSRACPALFCALTLVVASCSSGNGGGGSIGTLQSSVQNLTLDPDGTTTVLTFSQAPLAVGPSNFTADGGQTALTATQVGAEVTVAWDAYVAPSHTITVTGLPGIYDGTTTPSTTDGSAPTYTITGSAMNSGLGADTLEVTFTGPRVAEAMAEDPTNWALSVNATALDLTGSTFDLTPGTQILAITFGSGAHLHSTFTLAATGVTSVSEVAVSSTPTGGTAAGDSAAPSLVSVEQNLSEDEFGRVVDFTFDEAMSPAFSQTIGSFSVAGNSTTSVAQPSAGVLRVTFNQPVIPGVDSVTPSNMMDVHGNTVTLGSQAVAQSSPVVNSFASNDAVTVSNIGGDYIEAVFAQAFDAAEAVDDTNWTLVVDGSGIVESDQTFTYDFLSKTLRIDLDFDMINGDTFSVTGNSVLEVDGQAFSLAGAGTVGGDAAAPTVSSVLQNRTQDPSGQTLDVTFSEDIDGTAVATLPNWTVTGLTVSGATLLGSPNIVRLTLTGGAAVPGIATLSASNQSDLAGNAMSGATGLAVTSNDSAAPSITITSAKALEGADNDTVTVNFDDDMVEAQVENPANWAVESPIGIGMNTASADVDYNVATRQATLTFDAGNAVYFEQGNAYRVTLSTMIDIGANAITATSLDGTIAFETSKPIADAAWRDGAITTQATVRFSEHMKDLDDLFDPSTNLTGTRYVVRDSGGVLRGTPTSATPIDGGLGALLDFGFVINAGDTLDVLGGVDLVGNYMYPALLLPLAAEDTSEPDFGTQTTPLLAVSGERNDVITLKFDRELSPWGTESSSNFTITDGAPLDLEQATFEFDGVDEVTIRLDGGTPDSLTAASTYDVTIDNLLSEQGIEMSSASTLNTVAVSGDTSTAPTIGATSVRIDRAFPNALLVFADEALDSVAAEDEGRWLYAASTLPTSAVQVDPTTVRLIFPVNPIAGQNLAFNVMDLAGNESGAAAQAIQAFESTPPALVSVSGTSVPGEGGDLITVVFNEPVDRVSGLDASNYSVTNNGNALTLTSADGWYDSTSFAVNFFLAAGHELDSDESISVTVQNISDHSSNVMPAPVVLGGTVSGDTTTAPTVTSAYVNYRENAFGLLVDVQFDEAPDETFVTNPFNWDVTGGGVMLVLGVTRIDGDEYRVALSGALGSGDELEIVTGLPDLAGNLTVAPTTVTVAE